MDRRSFLTGAAIVAGGVVATALVGRTPQTDASTPTGEASEGAEGGDRPMAAPGSSSPPFDFANRTVTLNDGALMPILGIGTFRLSPEQAEASVTAALQSGYRLIDTARIYGNEDGVGRGVARSGVPRGDVFVTTKLWTADFGDAANAIDASLARLDLDYVDLLLLHHTGADDEEAYRAMEDAVVAGKVRSIGISNFYEDDFARIAGFASILPTVVQNETHPYFQETTVKEYVGRYGSVLESWFPLGGRGNTQVLFGDPTIADIAASRARTPAQVLLRWHLQTGNVAIPGSSDPDHIRENISIFDFELSADEMGRIRALDRGQRFSTY